MKKTRSKKSRDTVPLRLKIETFGFEADLSAAAVVAGGEEAPDDEAEDEEDEAHDHHGWRGQGQSTTGAAASTFFTRIKRENQIFGAATKR
jgi:hypothetical protein